MPLWLSVSGAALLSLVLYGLVRWKNHVLERHELRGPWRILAPVVR
jgi:LPXTG-motif cell wall-anchored protein